MDGLEFEKDDRVRPPDPEFVTSASGRRVSLGALREKVEAQFEAENAGRLDIFSQAETTEARRALLVESANYVLAQESIFPTREAKRALIDAAYANLFGFGPVEPYINDDEITLITIDGHDNLSMRRRNGPFERLPAIFDDPAHLRRTLARLLMLEGAQFVDWNFFLEIALSTYKRPVRLSVITPPVTPKMQVEVRLHPPTPFTLEALTACETLSEAAARQLVEHLRGEEAAGLLIVGQGGSGKTTLLGALLAELSGAVILLQRAAELRPPEGVGPRHAFPPGEEDPGVTMEALVADTLQAGAPTWLAFDEVRDDVAQAAWEALHAPSKPVWVFRSATKPLRIVNALTMTLRRLPEVMRMPQADLDALLARRFSMVILMGLSDGVPRVQDVARFAPREGGGLTLQSW